MWTIIVILIFLWLLGLLTIGGHLIHLLLIIAVIVFLIRLLGGQRPID